MHDNLVYDVGMHKGEDTAFYLAKGYRVVAIEADPALAGHCRRRFHREITDGRLAIVEGAIVEPQRMSEGRIRFFKNEQVSVWGTVNPDWRARNDRQGATSHEIEVACIDLAEVMAEHGVPHYIKIDIEGADRIALASLERVTQKPRFISIEDEKVDFARLTEDLDLMCRLGYRSFKAVQQQTIDGSVYEGKDRAGAPLSHRFEYGASGPFGADLVGPWLGRAELLVEYKWIFEMYAMFGDNSACATDADLERARQQLEAAAGRPLPGWYDTHATY